LGEELQKIDLTSIALCSIPRTLNDCGRDKIFIARGAAGVSIFSIPELKFIREADLRDLKNGGSVESISFDGKDLLLVMSTTLQDGFTGVVKMNLAGDILSSHRYDTRRSGVIAPGARSFFYDDRLFINNAGWIHIVGRNQLSQTTGIRPSWLSQKVVESRERYHYVVSHGDFYIDNNRLRGCGLSFETISSQRVRVAKIYQIPYK
jgi:hypothetical protein